MPNTQSSKSEKMQEKQVVMINKIEDMKQLFHDKDLQEKLKSGEIKLTNTFHLIINKSKDKQHIKKIPNHIDNLKTRMEDINNNDKNKLKLLIHDNTTLKKSKVKKRRRKTKKETEKINEIIKSKIERVTNHQEIQQNHILYKYFQKNENDKNTLRKEEVKSEQDIMKELIEKRIEEIIEERKKAK